MDYFSRCAYRRLGCENVFQVVPHKQKAFNLKLLIAQVLGRGLRIPQNLKDAIGADKIFLKVNNHEKWNHEIKTYTMRYWN